MNTDHLKQDFGVFLQWLTPLLVLGAKHALLYVVIPFAGIFVARSANWVFDHYAQPFLNRKFSKK